MANWDRELAKIDKQLASLPEDAPPPARASSGAASGAMPGGLGAATKPTRLSAGVALRLGLSAALGVGMLFWPYQARCGIGLAGYLIAVVAVVTSGVWSAVWTWRARAGRAHSLALLLVVWGLILGALELLPRVGYALPDEQRPAIWLCS
jgi:hypothetical protein